MAVKLAQPEDAYERLFRMVKLQAQMLEIFKCALGDAHPGTLHMDASMLACKQPPTREDVTNYVYALCLSV